jgi:hypothetical protein
MMNMSQLKKPELWLVALSGLFLSQVAVAAIQVELVVDTSTAPPTLQVVSNSSQCKGGPLDCIEVAKFTKPNIRFLLEDACEPDGPEYKLQQIRIGMVDKVWPTAANPLWDAVASDFNADADTGVIDLTAGKNKLGDDRIKFKNKNSADYMVFYEITAQECTGAGTITLDPRIRNYGK